MLIFTIKEYCVLGYVRFSLFCHWPHEKIRAFQFGKYEGFQNLTERLSVYFITCHFVILNNRQGLMLN